MEIIDPNEDKLKRAKKQVEEMKGFYIHLAIYIIINGFIIVNILVRSLSDGDQFWALPTFFTPFFWGIGLAFHASKVFGYNPFFGKKWEERQIKKYIEKDEQESAKYK
ncbi:MAG: 2TM domain-containing protein [Eudoraea sp.]|nr:2TM domain-containing protein [Eudoraea sp.]